MTPLPPYQKCQQEVATLVMISSVIVHRSASDDRHGSISFTFTVQRRAGSNSTWDLSTVQPQADRNTTAADDVTAIIRSLNQRQPLIRLIDALPQQNTTTNH